MKIEEKSGVVFDAGPIISLTLSGLLWVLESLKSKYPKDFIITPAIKNEIIDKPLLTKKYKFESIRVMPYIANGTLTVVDSKEIERESDEIQNIANKAFYTDKGPIKIIHQGEAEALAACIVLSANTLVIDERTTRYLIEAPFKIKKRLERKTKQKVSVDKNVINILKKKFKNINTIRSTELVTIAFEKDQLNFYEFSNINKLDNFKKTILEGALWALKSNGCAILGEEIETILRLEKKR